MHGCTAELIVERESGDCTLAAQATRTRGVVLLRRLDRGAPVGLQERLWRSRADRAAGGLWGCRRERRFEPPLKYSCSSYGVTETQRLPQRMHGGLRQGRARRVRKYLKTHHYSVPSTAVFLRLRGDAAKHRVAFPPGLGASYVGRAEFQWRFDTAPFRMSICDDARSPVRQ